MRNLGIVLSLAVAGPFLAAAPALAQTKQPAVDVPGAASAPVQSSLVVGALDRSAANLEVLGTDINIASDGIVLFSYFLKILGVVQLASPLLCLCQNCKPAPTAARPAIPCFERS